MEYLKQHRQSVANLHTITVIVYIGSVFAEPDSSLYICFSVAAFSYGNCEEISCKTRCMVVLIKHTFDLVVLNSTLICFISTVIYLH